MIETEPLRGLLAYELSLKSSQRLRSTLLLPTGTDGSGSSSLASRGMDFVAYKHCSYHIAKVGYMDNFLREERKCEL